MTPAEVRDETMCRGRRHRRSCSSLSSCVSIVYLGAGAAGAAAWVQGLQGQQGLQPGCRGCGVGAGAAAHRLASSSRGTRSHLLMTTWKRTLASRSRKCRKSRSDPLSE